MEEVNMNAHDADDAVEDLADSLVRQGVLRKIGTLKQIREGVVPCMDQEHEPPKLIALKPGTYEHVCPSCGQKKQFTIPTVTM
jgi:hypothetical protein